MEKTWFAINGTLEGIEFEGPSFFRFPGELARQVIDAFSSPGDWVFDPFCGFGTTLAEAGNLGRHAIGIEKDPERARFAASRVKAPSRVIVDNLFHTDLSSLPPVSLVLTSPPYTTLREWDEAGFSAYHDDLRTAFERISSTLAAGARIVVEVSNVRTDRGVRTVAWDMARIISDLYRFDGEVVRCNTGPEQAGPGYDHSYLLMFTVVEEGTP